MARPTDDDRTFARRHRRAKKRGPGSIVGLRVRDLAALFRDRYGDVLPDDDAGRDDVFVMANHLAMYVRGDPAVRITHWAETAAPWIAGDEFDTMLARIIPRPIRWRADKLAQRLGLTAADRDRLGITTIGAIDETREQRIQRRQERARLVKEAKRRAAGAVARESYRRVSLSQRRPWFALGISRRTWERQRTCVASAAAP